MPQDKRLVVTKAVVNKIKRLKEEESGDPDAAAAVQVYLEFIIPSVILNKDTSMTTKLFQLPHFVVPMTGRGSVLIVPKIIHTDCSKINKRHHYFDAVVAAEAICRRGDAECEKRAVQVAKTFTRFAIDSRIVNKMPSCVTHAYQQESPIAPSTRFLTSVEGLEDNYALSANLATAAKGLTIKASSHGQCFFRIGHGGMTAGDVCENARAFLVALKTQYPHAWKYMSEVKLCSPITEKIRFMEVHIQK